MSVNLIERHLEKLADYHKIVKNDGSLNQIRPDLRENLKKIKNPHNFNEGTWNQILSSERMIEIVNTCSCNDELIKEVVGGCLDEEERIQAFEYPEIGVLYEKLVEYDTKHKQKGLYWENRASFLPEFALYSAKYEKIENVDTFLEKNWKILSGYQFRRDWKELRIDYLYFLNQPYAKEMENKTQHFSNWFAYVPLFQELFEELEKNKIHSLYCEKFLNSISFSLEDTEDKTEFLKKILEWVRKTPEERLKVWIPQLFPSKESLLLEREIAKLIHHCENKEDDIYQILYPDQPQALVLSALVKQAPGKAEHFLFVKKAVKGKKKAFLRLVSENTESYLKIREGNCFFQSWFGKIVNLNSLNGKNLEKIGEWDSRIKSVERPIRDDIPLTFPEFDLLYNKNPIYADIFYELMDLPVDQRIRLCRELPSITKKDLQYSTNEELVKDIANLIREKSLSRRAELAQKQFQEMKAEDYLFLFLHWDVLSPYLEQYQNGKDIRFAYNHLDAVQRLGSIEEAKLEVYSLDDSYQFLLMKLDTTPTFVKENLTSFLNFCQNDLHKVFYQMWNTGYQSSQQLKNLSLITKAEIAGRLDEIKFRDEDFELEIGMNISSEMKTTWKKNTQQKKEFLVEETYDYETTIRLGERPVPSCQHWDAGSYSDCLLSNFDTNKKILIAKDKQGRLIARAIVRLTKSAENQPEIQVQKLKFKDIENLEVEETQTKVEEKATIFLERMYTSLDPEQAKTVKKMFVELLKEKAKEMKTKLICALEYRDVLSQDKKSSIWVYISHSKNGKQYIDSLGGSYTASAEGKYSQAELFVIL